jgi:hypothetical protein
MNTDFIKGLTKLSFSENDNILFEADAKDVSFDANLTKGFSIDEFLERLTLVDNPSKISSGDDSIEKNEDYPFVEEIFTYALNNNMLYSEAYKEKFLNKTPKNKKKNKLKVYLSGDMFSGWQDDMPEHKHIEYIDPRKAPQSSMDDFVNWDLNKVKEADIVFCHMAYNNPSGLGASWECSIASEYDIPIITSWEKNYVDPFFASKSLYLYLDFHASTQRLIELVEKEVKEKCF